MQSDGVMERGQRERVGGSEREAGPQDPPPPLSPFVASQKVTNISSKTLRAGGWLRGVAL